MIWLFSPLRNKADLAPELKESSGLVLIRAYLFGHHCKGHWLVPQTFTVHWRTPFFRLIIFWTFICRKVMSFFEWKSLKTKQSHNLLVTKKTEISEQPNPPSERTFAFRVWKAGLFWNIKAKSFSIFFFGWSFIRKNTGTCSFFKYCLYPQSFWWQSTLPMLWIYTLVFFGASRPVECVPNASSRRCLRLQTPATSLPSSHLFVVAPCGNGPSASGTVWRRGMTGDDRWWW